MSFSALRARKGFTLIELLLVIGIIAILASIVIVAINPTKQLADARNAQRRADVNTILNAIYQYSIDNSGNLPGNLSGSVLVNNGTSYKICKSSFTGTCNPVFATEYSTFGMFAKNLTGSYIVKMPQDPKVATSSGYTGYLVSKNASNRITVSADKPENGATISVTR